jgi:hypothetical protein
MTSTRCNYCCKSRSSARLLPRRKKSTGTAGASAADDPIRLYLKEIGKISLISGDKEVELARRIEGGENIIEDAVLRSSLLAQRLHQGV